VKVVKSKAYFKRYQVQFRRRREGKTDYHRRKKLTAQDKNKYNSPKYRLVVRITNSDVVCQIAYAKIAGDVILAAAYAHELPRYGLPVGLTNYSACYCTGLLLARRLLKKIGLENRYRGKVEADGKLFLPVRQKRQRGRRPFTALLDVGLARTTTGARIFAAMKGAVDGGIRVPHSPNRFRGYDGEKKQYNPEAARGYIFGEHVSKFMADLKENDPERYKKQFSQYIIHKVTSDKLEGILKKVHASIRKNPQHIKRVNKKAGKKSKRRGKLTLAQRKHRVDVKVAAFAAIKKKMPVKKAKAAPKRAEPLKAEPKKAETKKPAAAAPAADAKKVDAKKK